MANFLEKIWGDSDGYRCISTNPNGEIANNFLSPSESINPDFSRPIEAEQDVWYSPAIFNAPRRLKDNVKEVRALWLDVDLKSGYTHEEFIVKDVLDLCDTAGLDYPSYIFSGYGVHFYWIFESPVSPEEWNDLAFGLRELCIEHKLKADHQCTTDISRLLRVPGTKNFKDKKNPKDVTVENFNSTTLSAIREVLFPYIFKYKQRLAAKEVNKQFALEYQNSPKDAEIIATKCGQIANFKNTGGNISEPEWYAGLGILTLCENGEAVAHEWSKGHPKYSRKDTQNKFERAKDFSPTTCQRFESANPDICRACPHFGQITSPIQLGDIKPITVVVEEQKVALPMPHGYEMTSYGVVMLPSEENEERKKLTDTRIQVTAVMTSENGDDSEIEVVWQVGRKTYTANFKQQYLAADKEFDAWLKNHNIQIVAPIKLVKQYFIAGIRDVMRRDGVEIAYKKLGLHSDGFVIGKEIIDMTGQSYKARLSSSNKILLEPEGDLDEWIEATALLDKPEFWQHRFTVLAALGTPLFKLTGIQGCILSLAGESGAGKTTSANFGLSAYGDPKALTIDPRSTINAFYRFWNLVDSIPVCCNEAVTMDRNTLGLAVYAAANGHERKALQRTGEFRETGTWTTLSIFTSNLHLMSLPDTVIGEAERRRIFEVSLGADSILTIESGRRLNGASQANFGLAGRKFISYILPRKKEITKKIRERVDQLQSGVESVHRYNIWLIATVSVTAEIAKELGLIKFETVDVVRNSIELLIQTNAQSLNNTEKIEQLIEEFQREHTDKFWEFHDVSGWIKEGKGEVLGRYDLNKSGHAYAVNIPVKRFKHYALEHNIDITQIKHYCKLNNIEEKVVKLTPKVTARCFAIPKEVSN